MTGRTSVVIPCHNVDRYLGDALESVRRQTLPVREIVLVDDGSDRPIERPAGWAGPPLVLIRQPNRGLPAARNTGVHAAAGEFVAFLDADDLWDDRKVERQTAAFDADPNAVAAFTRCVDRPGFFAFGPYPPVDVSMDEFLLVLWYGQFFPPSSVVVRRHVLLEAGGFDERLRIGEDLDLWLRLLRRGRFVQVPEPLCWYRRHAAQLTTNLQFKISANGEARRIIIKRDRDLLIGSGIPDDRLWDSYRNEVLLAYYRRQFEAARPLLWRYWREHSSDWRVLAYAILSCLPAGLVNAVRPGLAAIGDAAGSAPGGEWTRVVGDLRARLGSLHARA